MWWFGRDKDLPEGMIDLHNHLAPGIDDGSTSDEDTLAMLDQFLDVGFTKVAITSHLQHPLFGNVTAPLIKERTAHVKALAEAHQLPIEIHPGAEIYYRDDLLSRIEAGELLPLGGDSPYYLIEFAVSDPMPYIKDIGFQMGVKGLRPVMAHPERYHVLQRKPELIHEWRRAGWAMQLDLPSLLGQDGRGTRKVARRWLKEGAFDLAASDLHRPLKPEGQLRKMLNRLVQDVGQEEAHRLLVENPQRILQHTHLKEAPDRDD